MKVLREMLALNRFDTMRNRHRRAWEKSHLGEYESQAEVLQSIVKGMQKRLENARPDFPDFDLMTPSKH